MVAIRTAQSYDDIINEQAGLQRRALDPYRETNARINEQAGLALRAPDPYRGTNARINEQAGLARRNPHRAANARSNEQAGLARRAIPTKERRPFFKPTVASPETIASLNAGTYEPPTTRRTSAQEPAIVTADARHAAFNKLQDEYDISRLPPKERAYAATLPSVPPGGADAISSGYARVAQNEAAARANEFSLSNDPYETPIDANEFAALGSAPTRVGPAAGPAAEAGSTSGVTKTIDENGNPVYTYGGGYDPEDRTLDPNFIGMDSTGRPMYSEDTSQSALARARRLPANAENTRLLGELERNDNQSNNEQTRQRAVSMIAAMTADINASGMSERGAADLDLVMALAGDPQQSVQAFGSGPEAIQSMGAAIQEIFDREPPAVADFYQKQMQNFFGGPSAFGAQKFADGGEVEEAGEEEYSGTSVDPQAQGATAGLDSGDYVIPVEAMRFYGSKFFKDLIEKAENAED